MKREKRWTVDGAPMKPELKRLLKEAEQGSGVAPCVTVNRVSCDSSSPGGYTVTPVPVQPGQEI